jgi:hypothetical protein
MCLCPSLSQSRSTHSTIVIPQPRIEPASDGELLKERETVSLEVREEEPAIGGDVYVIAHHGERSESRSSIRKERADGARPSVRLGIERRLDPMAFCQIARRDHLRIPELARL